MCAPPTAALGGRPALPRVTELPVPPRAAKGWDVRPTGFGQSHAPPRPRSSLWSAT